jgi:hypothetical protein
MCFQFSRPQSSPIAGYKTEKRGAAAPQIDLLH